MTDDIRRKLPVPWQPHKYQRTSVKFLIEHAAAGLLLDPGLGKSSITLAAIRYLKKQGVLDKALVIAPLRVCHSVWPREAEKWRDFKDLRVVVLHGTKKQQQLDTPADVYVINPEGLDWLLGKPVSLRKFKSLGFDTLVIDELTKFKHPNTNRFKALKKVLPTFARRWGLTGSPAANGLMGLFGQMYCLDEGAALGQYITHYRMKYFYSDYTGFNWQLKPGAEQQIYDAIRPLTLRISDEVLDMPQLVENDIYVDLPRTAMKVYRQVEDDLLAQLEGGQVAAANSAVASGKCRQIANGSVYLTPEVTALVNLPTSNKKHAVVHEAKLDALESLVEELQGSPLLVAYEFGHDLAQLRKRFGKNLPYIGGGVSAKKGTRIAEQWNAGQIPVLLGHPSSIAHGVNLQEAGHHVAWYAITWDYELYDQFMRRVYRQGNAARRVYVHRIISRDTIDERIAHVLRGRARGQNALFDALNSLKRK